jgi:hypothetical protein
MPPQQQNLKDTIENSSPSNWQEFDTPETWVHWSEKLEVREIGIDGHGERRNVNQPGFATLPDDQHDQESQVRISYSGIPFDQLPILSLDGHRITMIQPQTDHNTGDHYLNQYEVTLSRIMSQANFQQEIGGRIDVQVR